MSSILDRELARFHDKPVPDHIDHRTAAVLNQVEALLDEHNHPLALRLFRARWRNYVIHLSFPTANELKGSLLLELSGRKLYGPFWFPGGVSHKVADAVTHIRKAINGVDFEEIFE